MIELYKKNYFVYQNTLKKIFTVLFFPISQRYREAETSGEINTYKESLRIG